MEKPIQKRALATRSKLVETAQKLISANGFDALRVEQVVQDAGVAKGTFFSHFHDKDALMDILIGSKIDTHLDLADAQSPPETLHELVGRLLPLMQFMTSERYVFDLILRHSGAAAKEQIGPIALTFERQIDLFATWLSGGPFRNDVPAVLLAEGIQAFVVQCVALHFCAINSEEPMQSRLTKYLDAWLCPKNT